MNDEARGIAEDFGLPYDVAARINAGMDILMDDNYPGDKAAELLLAAERKGEDAEKIRPPHGEAAEGVT